MGWKSEDYRCTSCNEVHTNLRNTSDEPDRPEHRQCTACGELANYIISAPNVNSRIDPRGNNAPQSDTMKKLKDAANLRAAWSNESDSKEKDRLKQQVEKLVRLDKS